MKIVALYARVSTDRQEKQATIKSQIEEIKEKIKADGNVLGDNLMFLDDGWTGSMLARPGLDKARDAGTNKKYETLYIYDRDRISRKFIHQGLILEEFEKSGVELKILHDPEIKSAEDQVMVQMKGVFAEYERVKIAERTRRGKIGKARNGKVVLGPGPYGYTYILKNQNKDGYYIINKFEAEVVRKIFKWVADEKLTIRRVIKRLQDEGIKPRKSTKGVWNNSTLSRLLNNESYIGTTYYNKSYAVEPERPLKDIKYKKVTKTSRKMRQKGEWIKIKVPEIISKELFNGCKEQLRKNAWFSKRCQKYDYLLTGLLFCSCGCRMNGEGVNGHRYYRCSNRIKRFPLPKDCEAGGVNIKRIEGVVWSKIERLLLDPTLLRDQAELWLSRQRNGQPDSLDEMELDRLKKALTDLMSEEIRQAKVYGAGITSFDAFSELMKDLKMKRGVLESQLKKSQKASEKPEIPDISVNELCHYLPEVLKSFLKADRKSVMRQLIGKIVVDSGRENATIKGWIPLNTLEKSLNYVFRSNSRDCRFTQCREEHAV
jgi:site-specific DNA recombinase